MNESPRAPVLSLVTVHHTADGDRAVCGSTRPLVLAFDRDDPDISCDHCRLWLAGYRAGQTAATS